ncbi:uncharacterized protein PV09_01053 [Verruconis gallopava]|uniref:Chitin-binding type-4 domain-containing protein n=1 Tax=Verruconis gallopava TaxID=253628 RepID=A0A0D2AN24_9PEZI|nr:uncharacterized protein PV09_01053 [Verruconis gallopava]KIW08118.1 hypothetical protein PV09_01053 [Verruconis gallopava]
MRISAAVFSIISLAYGHGIVTSPKPRQPGPAMQAACGQQVYNNQASNDQGNIQNMLQVGASQSDFDPAKCNVWLCKAYQFADNSANVQTYTAGQVVPIKVDISAPHTGVMNMSIVNTATNTVIGSPLISFSDYASNAHTIPANNTDFSITMPDVSSQCGTAGACVIQWFWDARSVDQTYEACIDFTMGGSGGGATTPTTTAAASVSTTKAAVATTTSAAASASTPETDCEDDTPAPSSVPEVECDDGFIATKERRHPRDFSTEA